MYENRELQEQARDQGGGATPRTVGGITPRSTSGVLLTPRGGVVTPHQQRRLSDIMAAAGMGARDGETVVSDVGVGEGYADFFAESIRAEDEALDAIEQAARSSSSRAESLYSTMQLQAAGLEEENEALAEKMEEMEREQNTLNTSLQEMTDKCLGLQRENSCLRDANRGLQELNHALEHDMHRENDDLKAEIALLQATSKAQRQELEMERTKMNQKMQQEKREALEEMQLSKSQVEKEIPKSQCILTEGCLTYQ